MNGETYDDRRTPPPEAIERIGGSLVNVVLGALILWVGQTTFRHAGMLASFDQKFSGIDHRFDATTAGQESLRKRFDDMFDDVGERTRSRFTREDAEKMGARISQLREGQAAFERQVFERLGALQLKLIALETGDANRQEVAVLRTELERLRGAVVQQLGGSRIAGGSPSYISSQTPAR